jgi:plasmid stabilization system protein ParE
MKYRLTDAARQDIREIVEYIRDVQQSPQNSRLVARRLKARFAKLLGMPHLGHVREELSDDKGSLPVSTISVVTPLNFPTISVVTPLNFRRTVTPLNFPNSTAFFRGLEPLS